MSGTFRSASFTVFAFLGLVAMLYLIPGHAEEDASENASVERDLRIHLEDTEIAAKSGTRMSLLDLDGRMFKIPASKRSGVLADPGRIAQLMNNVLLAHWLAEDARESGLQQDPAIKAQIIWLATEVLAGAQQMRIMEDGELDDYSSRARELYLVNPDSFKTRETLSFVHLLINVDERTSAAEARARAEQYHEQVKAGDNLTALAAAHSEDPSSKTNKGRFEDIVPEALDPQFAAALQQMKVGETGIAGSSYGVHLVELTGREVPRQETFEEAKEQLVEQARQAHRQRILEDYLAEFYAGELELRDGAVEKIRNRYAK